MFDRPVDSLDQALLTLYLVSQTFLVFLQCCQDIKIQFFEYGFDLTERQAQLPVEQDLLRFNKNPLYCYI
jgi:hypothetical protein